jgi:hypothetical protein
MWSPRYDVLCWVQCEWRMRNAAHEPDLRVVVEVVGSAVCVDRLTGWQSPLTFRGRGLLCPLAANPPTRPPVADKPGRHRR